MAPCLCVYTRCLYIEPYPAYKPVVSALVSTVVCHVAGGALPVVPMLPRRPEGPLAQPIDTQAPPERGAVGGGGCGSGCLYAII